MNTVDPDITLIAAMDRNRVIGAGGGMPWHIPADLKFFKHATRDKPILMGRRTFDAIGRALPRRRNLVLTRSTDFSAPGCERVADLDAAIDIVRGQSAAELMVIGGAEVFALALPRATCLLLTAIEASYAGDTYFPAFDETTWVRVDERALEVGAEAPACRVLTWRRRGE